MGNSSKVCDFVLDSTLWGKRLVIQKYVLWHLSSTIQCKTETGQTQLSDSPLDNFETNVFTCHTTINANAGTFSSTFFYILQQTYSNQEKRKPAPVVNIYKDGAPAIEEALIMVPLLCQEDEQNKTYKGRDKNADADGHYFFC